MTPGSLFLKVDGVQIPVPDLEAALAFYRDRFGHELVWRTKTAAGLRMSRTDAELVIQTERAGMETNLLVASADDAAVRFAEAGGRVLVEPFEIPIGRCTLVEDPWGNQLVLLDDIKGRLVTDANGVVETNADGSLRVAPTQHVAAASRPVSARGRRRLAGERVVLRQPLSTDTDDRLSSGRDPELVRMYGGDYRSVTPLTRDDAERWAQTIRDDPLAWVIEAESKAIGHCRLHTLDHDNLSARYAIGIFNPDFWSRGYGTEATRLVLRFVFEDLGLHRVDLRVLSYNSRAIAAFKKCGFVEEGRERDSARVSGEWHTDVRMSILKHEYRALSGNWSS
jgi:RimJ/RimL family protein N-acetyltransferase/predicted enzyme related to lactoylglutathione lyase